MGYTHSWEGPVNCSVPRWEKLQEDLQKVMAARGIPLADGSGDRGTVPRVRGREICFNGVGAQAHETFAISHGQNREFGFCKTAQKPYDIIVVAALVIVKEYNPDFIVSSDGDEAELQDGVDLCKRVLGYGKCPLKEK
jgi:hypothetical protein